jgi:hypothetical protein
MKHVFKMLAINKIAEDQVSRIELIYFHLLSEILTPNFNFRFKLY